MLKMEGSISCFFLLVLGIPLDFGPDFSYKQGGFSNDLLKKSLKFASNR